MVVTNESKKPPPPQKNHWEVRMPWLAGLVTPVVTRAWQSNELKESPPGLGRALRARQGRHARSQLAVLFIIPPPFDFGPKGANQNEQKLRKAVQLLSFCSAFAQLRSLWSHPRPQNCPRKGENILKTSSQ